MIKIERIYRDTSNYEEKKGLPFAKAFAKSLEWLYNKSYFSEEEDDFLWHAKYQMSGEIPLYDLMSIEALVISRAWTDFRVSGVNTLISQLEAGAFTIEMFTEAFGYANNHAGQKTLERLIEDKAIERIQRGKYRKLVSEL